MTKRVFIYPNESAAVPNLASYVMDWSSAHPRAGLGGATGRSPVSMWNWIWDELGQKRPNDLAALLAQDVVFLDEYFSGLSYYHWAWRNLRVGRGGFGKDKVFVPRGCFYEDNRLVSSARLDEILSASPGDWVAQTQPGEDGVPPEIRIKKTAKHPVLAEIGHSLKAYERIVQAHSQRLQILGLGRVGHIGFVEVGAAARDTQTLLTRLGSSTLDANNTDWVLRNEDGDASMEPSRFAISQGVSSILSSSELLIMAWKESKHRAVRKLFLDDPSPNCPCACAQLHDNVTVFLDEGAFGNLDRKDLEKRGWSIESDKPVPLVN